MFDFVLTAIALAIIGVMGVLCLSVLLLPVYLWLLWRTDDQLAEARRLKLLE